jgi:hypothetical protein
MKKPTLRVTKWLGNIPVEASCTLCSAAFKAPAPNSNTEKEADDWVSGDDPMTGAQASYLKTLSEECDEPESFRADLTKAEASKRIDALKAKRSPVRHR